MNPERHPSPFETLSLVIRALREAVAAWGGRGLLGEALVWLVHRRLGEICGRMERLAARFQAGRVLRRAAPRADRAERVVVARVAGERVWPVSFGWLVKAASWQAAGFGLQLRAVLETPEMVALLVACPQAARILRPLCRALAIETAVLRPGVAVVAVKRVRVRKQRVEVDLGRVPIPRGAMAWVRRDGFAKG